LCLNCFGLCSTTILSSPYYSLFSAVLIIFPALRYSIHRINVSAYRILSNVSASVAISDCIYSEQQSQTRSGNQVLPLHNQESRHSRKSAQHTFRRTALRPASAIFVRSVQQSTTIFGAQLCPFQQRIPYGGDTTCLRNFTLLFWTDAAGRPL
jgi:hypothetical protein